MLLIGVLLFVALSLGSSPVNAQPGTATAAVGTEAISAMLIEQGPWTGYWSTLGASARPPASAGSSTVGFTRRCDKIVGHVSIPAMAREFEFEAVIVADGPNDQEYPFKGAGAGSWCWFRPR